MLESLVCGAHPIIWSNLAYKRDSRLIVNASERYPAFTMVAGWQFLIN